MKTLKKIVSVMLCLAMLGSFCILSSHAEDVLPVSRPAIIQYSVNVRAVPSDTGERIGEVSSGKEVFVTTQTITGGKVWYQIRYKDTVGYIIGTAALLIEEIGTVTASTANVRITPQTGNVVLLYGEALRGDALYILQTFTENGITWHKVYYKGFTGYVLAEEAAIMKLPEEAQNAKYKKYLQLEVTAQYVPKGYTMTVCNEVFASDGLGECTARVAFGQLTSDGIVTIQIRNTDGNLVGESNVILKVDNRFLSRVISFFAYIFCGFRYGTQVITIR